MKKTVLAIALLFAGAVSAQKSYVSFSGGIHGVAAPSSLTSGGALEGSYGDGYGVQARLGYMLTEKLGVDLGVGYLHGNDQQVVESGVVNVIGRARAFGASLAGIYNVTENVYVRAGVLTKLGGKTDIKASVKAGPVNVDVTRDNHGSFPVGFLGAFGLKFKIADKWSLFAEMEYQGINVSADKSKLTGMSGSIAGNKFSSKSEISTIVGKLPAQAQAQIAPLLKNPLFLDEVSYVDAPTLGKPETKSFDAPYSSFGLNVGVTYSFDW